VLPSILKECKEVEANAMACAQGDNMPAASNDIVCFVQMQSGGEAGGSRDKEEDRRASEPARGAGD
jgi:hypothetical protein